MKSLWRVSELGKLQRSFGLFWSLNRISIADIILYLNNIISAVCINENLTMLNIRTINFLFEKSSKSKIVFFIIN